jgi:hypothetical protein
MNFSLIESQRFGFNIYRDNIKSIGSLTLENLFCLPVDIAVLRLPTHQQHTLYALNEAGLPYLVADTFVEYIIKTKSLSKIDLLNKDLEFYECHQGDMAVLDQIVGEIFHNYTNHYYSNPYLARQAITDGYKEWVKNCLGTDGIVWLVKKDKVPAAFFSGTIANGVFSFAIGGVLPSHEGQGIYLDSLKTIPYLLAEKGIGKCTTSTQIQNLVVQKQWQMAGWSFTKSLSTLHVNLFLHQALSGLRKVARFSPATRVPFPEFGLAYITKFLINEKKYLNSIQSIHLKDCKEEQDVVFYFSNPVLNQISSNSIVSVILKDGAEQVLSFYQITLKP